MLTGAEVLMDSISQSVGRAADGLATVADDFEQADLDSKRALEALA
jgi:hypothetical protein